MSEKITSWTETPNKEEKTNKVHRSTGSFLNSIFLDDLERTKDDHRSLRAFSAAP